MRHADLTTKLGGYHSLYPGRYKGTPGFFFYMKERMIGGYADIINSDDTAIVSHTSARFAKTGESTDVLFVGRAKVKDVEHLTTNDNEAD